MLSAYVFYDAGKSANPASDLGQVCLFCSSSPLPPPPPIKAFDFFLINSYRLRVAL